MDFIFCDKCKNEIIDFKNDLFHFSGNINNNINTHIHLCKKCVNFYRKEFPIFIDFDSIEKTLNGRGYSIDD